MKNSENESLEEYKEYRFDEAQFEKAKEDLPNLNLYVKPLIGTEQIRQFVYCKRILYFRNVLHAPMKKTYKMEYGEKKHDKLQQIANKTEETVQKYFNVYLKDPKIGLVGLIDYFEYDGNEAFPIEIKSGNQPPDGIDNPHKLQVAAQAILIEKGFDFLVKKVRIFYSKEQEMVEYPIKIEDKLRVLRLIDEIHQMLMTEKIPEPTIHEGKCVDCECKLYCLRA